MQGYLHIPYAWGGQINTPDTLCMNNIRILSDIMNRFTNIRTEPYEHRIRLDGGGDLRSYPVIYVAVGTPFEFTNDEIALVTGPGEFYVDYQLDLKRRSPLPATFFFGYTNGYLGYFPTRKAWEENWGKGVYEHHKWVEVGAGERFIERALELIAAATGGKPGR